MPDHASPLRIAPSPRGQCAGDAPLRIAAGGTDFHPNPELVDAHVGSVGMDELRAWARMLDDVERVRVACDLRVSALKRENRKADKTMLTARDGLAAVERAFTRQVERAYRDLPISDWTRPIPGVGDKLMGRLIAEIGDPATRPNPAKLLAYCGVGDPALKRVRGMRQEDAFRLGSPKAKAILLNPDTGIAAQIVRHRPEPYRSIYDERKAVYEEFRPDWPQIRRDRAARRVAVKRFLIDLWRESQRLAAEPAPDQPPVEARRKNVGGDNLAPTKPTPIPSLAASAQTSTTPRAATRPIRTSAS